MAETPARSGGKRSRRGFMRVGDAGRDTAVGVLKRAFAKGQLTQDEFEARVVAAYKAATRKDLRPLLEDLPEYQAVRSDPRRKAYWLD